MCELGQARRGWEQLIVALTGFTLCICLWCEKCCFGIPAHKQRETCRPTSRFVLLLGQSDLFNEPRHPACGHGPSRRSLLVLRSPSKSIPRCISQRSAAHPLRRLRSWYYSFYLNHPPPRACLFYAICSTSSYPPSQLNAAIRSNPSFPPSLCARATCTLSCRCFSPSTVSWTA